MTGDRASPPAPHGWRRAAVAALAGLAAALVVVLSLGLPWTPVGAGDNGDGHRLYCGAGLTPLTADHRSNWKGGVVLDFATGGPDCPDPIASDALPLLRLATQGSGPTWSLASLGVLYAVLVGLCAAAAAWAIRPGPRLLVLVPALVPLVGPVFTRFFVSTFSEPAGLLGAYALCCGAGVLAGTGRSDRAARGVGLFLTAGGGLVAAAAKPSYAPLLVIASALCACTAVTLPRRPGGTRIVGVTTAVLTLLLAVLPVTAGLRWQDRHAAAINTHNLVFTAVLPQVGIGALAPMGLPAAAESATGRAYYLAGATGVPGADVIAARPGQVRTAAYDVLLAHPLAAVELFGTGMTATLGAQLTYLPSAPVSDTSVPPPLGTTVGEQGAYRAQLLAWLDGLPVPWLPALVAAVGVLVAILARRSRSHLVRALSRLAALGAVAGVGLVVVAVLGDGMFEIAKHVWLAAYFLAQTAVAAALAGVVGAARRVHARKTVSDAPRRSHRSPLTGRRLVSRFRP